MIRGSNWKDNFPKENRYFETENGILYCNDVLKQLAKLPDGSVDCVITSPPYWALRDYGIEGQLGLEPTFIEYLENLWQIFDEIYRVLKKSGTCWVNLGDTYYGGGKGKTEGMNKAGGICGGSFKNMDYAQKSLCMIPERFAIGMIERGWVLRNQIIWHKPNAMPQSVKDRFTIDFEKIFFFVKQRKYYFKQQFEPHKSKPHGGQIVAKSSDVNVQYGIGGVDRFYKPQGRNKRTVWPITTKPFKGAHFAVFPPDIPEICIDAGCPDDGIVLDPFFGSGTTGVVAGQLCKKWIGIELNPDYCEIAKQRLTAIGTYLF